MNDKSRHFNIVVNKGADCYDAIPDILANLNKCRYAYILHNKDVNEDGELKTEHLHIVLDFDNARGFNAVSKIFKGAHIEKGLYLASSVQYLIHKNDQAKHQYDSKDIITNDNQFVNNNINEKPKKPILTEDILINEFLEMYRAGTHTDALMYFYYTYGMEQTKPYRQMIVDLMHYPAQLCHVMKIQDKDCIDKYNGLIDEDLPF